MNTATPFCSGYVRWRLSCAVAAAGGICTLLEPALSLEKVPIYICRHFTTMRIHHRKRNTWNLLSSRANTRVERQSVTSQAAAQLRHESLSVRRQWSFCVNFLMHGISCSSVMAFPGRIVPKVGSQIPCQITVSLILHSYLFGARSLKYNSWSGWAQDLYNLQTISDHLIQLPPVSVRKYMMHKVPT